MDITELGVSITNPEMVKVEQELEPKVEMNVEPKVESKVEMNNETNITQSIVENTNMNEIPEKTIDAAVDNVMDKVIEVKEKKVSFEDEVRKRKFDKEIKSGINETVKEIKETNTIMSFINNNLQTVIFGVIMIIFCIGFHYVNMGKIKARQTIQSPVQQTPIQTPIQQTQLMPQYNHQSL